MQVALTFDAQTKDNSAEVYIDDTAKWPMIDELLKSLPHPNSELSEGVIWGSCDVLFTPAFWKIQYYLSDFPEVKSHRLGDTILEEIVACLLGGYGLPSDLGLLAFQRLKTRKLIKKDVGFEALLSALQEPFERGNGSRVKYRFYKQKSRFIARLLQRRDLNDIPLHKDLALREWLLSVDGVGPKTASWITRNWLNSEQVAILDVHLIRAGIIAGIFNKNLNVSKSYFEMEKKFLNFCQALEVKPSCMDALIWWKMKEFNRLAIDVLK